MRVHVKATAWSCNSSGILNISPCHLFATVAVTMASISYHHSKEKLGKQNEYGENSSFGFIEAVH